MEQHHFSDRHCTAVRLDALASTFHLQVAYRVQLVGPAAGKTSQKHLLWQTLVDSAVVSFVEKLRWVRIDNQQALCRTAQPIWYCALTS